MTRFEVLTSATAVDLWTDVRLPFEPRGTAREARSALRTALTALAPTGELAAVYTAPPGGFCDLENVLIYNVGPGAFQRLAERRLLLVRRFASPVPPPSGAAASHHHRYSTDLRGVDPWPAVQESVIAERRFLLPPLRPLGPESFWYAARATIDASAPAIDRPPSGDTLALTVELELPTASPVRLASALKALLDGVVSSFHRHDGSGDRALLVGRLLAKLAGRATEAEVWRLLSAGPAELGQRALLHTWRDTIKWNPADDALVAIDVRMTRGGAEPGSCRARLLDIR